ncbi:hypothetical protein LguiB_027117 [Lonicera macranthoides]
MWASTNPKKGSTNETKYLDKEAGYILETAIGRSYIEENTVENGSNEVEFRIVESQCGVYPSLKTTVPISVSLLRLRVRAKSSNAHGLEEDSNLSKMEA